MRAAIVERLMTSPARLLIVTTPAIPSARPATLRIESRSSSQMEAKSAPNIGESELKIASIEAGRTSAAAEYSTNGRAELAIPMMRKCFQFFFQSAVNRVAKKKSTRAIPARSMRKSAVATGPMRGAR